MYLKKSSGITTLSCNEGSIRLRPEWPWRPRRYRIAPDESVQYWFVCLFPPPPVMLLFHFSSDQWWQYKKCFWKLSFLLQNSIAPSSSPGRLPWRRKIDQFLRHWIIGDWIFSWFNIGPSSFPNRYSSCGWAGRISSLWFCFGLWSACKRKYIRVQRTIFELHLRGFLLVVVVFLVAQVRDQLIQSHEKFCPTSENCPCLLTQFQFPLHIYLASNRL